VSSTKLKFKAELAVSMEQKKRNQLMTDHKLILVLDIDHTLLHSVMGRHELEGVHCIDIDGAWFTTKLRPHLDYFLE
jgi:hypothetical protein